MLQFTSLCSHETECQARESSIHDSTWEYKGLCQWRVSLSKPTIIIRELTTDIISDGWRFRAHYEAHCHDSRTNSPNGNVWKETPRDFSVVQHVV